jgi:hypothetical protein
VAGQPSFRLLGLDTGSGASGLALAVYPPHCTFMPTNVNAISDFILVCAITTNISTARQYYLAGTVAGDGIPEIAFTGSWPVGSDISQITGVIVRSDGDTWTCRLGALQYRNSATGVVTDIPANPAPFSGVKLIGCAANPKAGMAVLVFNDWSSHYWYVCRYPYSGLPENASGMVYYSDPRCVNGLMTDSPTVWSPQLLLSDDGNGIAIAKNSRVFAFNVSDIVAADAIDSTNTRAFSLANVLLAAYSPPTLMAVFGSSSGLTPTIEASVMTEWPAGTASATVTGSVWHQYPPRALGIDQFTGMAYYLDNQGTLFRMPVDEYGATAAESVASVCGPTMPLDAIARVEVFPVAGRALVFCGNPSVGSIAVVEVANCNATNPVDCLADVRHCTWYLYEPMCVLRAAAVLDICAGGNASRCVDEIPIVTGVTPGSGPYTGGNPVYVFVSVSLWTDPSIQCSFGGTLVNGTYPSIFGSIACIAPAMPAAGRETISVYYKGVEIPSAYVEGDRVVSYDFTEECGEDADCTARYDGTNTCVYTQCVDGACEVGLTTAGSVCTSGGYTGSCDGQGNCAVICPNCTDCQHDSECSTRYAGDNACILAECITGTCMLTLVARGTVCEQAGMIGKCDGSGGCVDCLTTSDCASRYAGSTECTAPICENETCRMALVARGTACTANGTDGQCTGAGICADCLTTADCASRYTGTSECVSQICALESCQVALTALGTACTVGTLEGECDGQGSCVPISCNGSVPCPPDSEVLCTEDADCADIAGTRHGFDSALGPCRVWRCGLSGICYSGAADESTACTVMTASGCSATPPVNGTTVDGLCSASGVCVIPVDEVPSPDQCTDGKSCLARACVGLFAGCAVDADCDGGTVARECAATRCSQVTHLCENYTLDDGAPCVPSISGACSVAQLGACVAGMCTLADLGQLVQCTTDAVCTGATCLPNGTCTVLEGLDLVCSAALAACADSATGTCNGRGQCAWQPAAACDDSDLCTIDLCDVSTGLCTHTEDSAVCPSLPAGVIVGIALLGVSIVGIVVAFIAFYIMQPRHLI